MRGAHPARIFRTVERQRVSSDLRTPERAFEMPGEAARFGVELARGGVISHPPRAMRRHALGGVDIALHFGERDRAFRQPAVGMEHRVVGILPALIDEALL